MLNARREDPNLIDRAEPGNPRRAAQIRFFGLLALLIPLFAGLQLVVREGVPRVEVRLVPQDVQTTVPVVVPVEVPVERVVERVVYVAVERQEALPPDSEFESARGNVAAAPEVIAGSGVEPDDTGPMVADTESDGPALGVVAAVTEPTDVPPLTGSVAAVPPVIAPVAPRAAPVVVASRAPVVVEEVAEEPAIDEPTVAMDEAPADIVDEPVVAEAPVDEPPVVATERVALYTSEVPIVREDDGPSIGLLRHELFVTVAKPAAPPVDAGTSDQPGAEEVAAEEAGDSPAGSEPQEEAAEASEPDAAPPVDAAAIEEQQPTEGMTEEQPEAAVVDGDEAVVEPEPEVQPEAVATQTTESLLSEAATIRADVVDPGSNNGPAIAVLEHQLVARPAAPEREADEKPDAQSNAQPEAEASTEVADEQSPEAIAESANDETEQGAADDGDVASAERRQGELAIVGETPDEGHEGEPGQ